ncbi:MAG: CDP-alcohol phosphatidyltransferase family protein [Calditrichaeota bacterium]|nr:CDP-alcohol phosphatidyltransferase family protein [Calditrichota bacterium]
MVFGLANLITILRLLIVLFIGTFYILLENYLISLMALIVLAGDGLDGKIARSRKETSELGEYLDKETDAFFLHIMIMSAVFKDILWEGTVIIGMLRYLFVLTIFILGDLSKKERRSRSGRYIYVFAVVSLILSFLPLPGIYIPAIFLATGLLLYSFGRDFIWLFSTR